MKRILLLFFLFLACDTPEKLMRKAKNAELQNFYTGALRYYEKILRKFPDYEKKDSVYVRMLELCREWNLDSLYVSLVRRFAEEGKDRELPGKYLYEGGLLCEEKRIAKRFPERAESLYRLVIEKAPQTGWADSAKRKIKYLNEKISLPYGKVYVCEVCGKVLRAEKHVKLPRKYRYSYTSKYPVEKIKKGRCYEHEIIKVKTGKIYKCPITGKIVKRDVKVVECMRCEKDKYRVEVVSDSSCCPGYSYAMISLGDTWGYIKSVLGETKDVYEFGIEYMRASYTTLFGGYLDLYFRYSHRVGDYILIGVSGKSRRSQHFITQLGWVPSSYFLPDLSIPNAPTGVLKRIKGRWYYEDYQGGVKIWKELGD